MNILRITLTPLMVLSLSSCAIVKSWPDDSDARDATHQALAAWDFGYQCDDGKANVMSDGRKTYVLMPMEKKVMDVWVQKESTTVWRKTAWQQGSPYIEAEFTAARWSLAMSNGIEIHCWKPGHEFSKAPVTAHSKRHALEKKIKILEARLTAILQQLGETP